MYEATHIEPLVLEPATKLRVAQASIENAPLAICLLGPFHVLQDGCLTTIGPTSKAAAMLSMLALRPDHAAPRKAILSRLWPESSQNQACAPLNTLVHSLHERLGLAPVVNARGTYALNRAGGVVVDVACFDTLLDAGDTLYTAGDPAAGELYARALRLFHGDLAEVAGDERAAMERERLRVRYLGLLLRLAYDAHIQGDVAHALAYLHRLLIHDPCREDAHRLIMRVYHQQGARAQALRHYRVFEQTMRADLDATPEAATIALFDQIRLHPDSL